MANHKTGKNLICPNCSKEFYISGYRLNLHKNHYCSLKCLSVFTLPERKKKLLKKQYPFIAGKCLHCKGDIVIQNAKFDKVNRKYCSRTCKGYGGKGKIQNWTPEMRRSVAEKISKKNKGVKFSLERRLKMRETNLGSKSHFWKGGLTDENRKQRNSVYHRDWRKAVYERDNYTCQDCGARSGKGKAVKLNADHIKPWSLNPESRFDVDNGRTLCLDCHKKTDTFGYKSSVLRQKINKNEIK